MALMNYKKNITNLAVLKNLSKKQASPK